jgi:uncharacterized tellurite resistance protein B-like protein
MTAHFRSSIQTMTDAQREWFATAMVAMVVADGSVSQGEVEKLMQSISFVRSPQVVERLKKYVHFQSVPTLSPFQGWEKDLKGRALLMIDLMEVAIADKEFSPKERDQFHHIGRMLGFPNAKVDELIALGGKFIENMAQS